MPARKRSIAEDRQRGQRHEDHARGHRAAEVRGAGLAEQAVDRAPGAWRSGRTMNRVAPNSPSEIANANPAATSAARATIGRSTSRQTRARATRRASPRPRAGAGRWRAGPGSSIRTTNGSAISACAIGTSHHEPRRSSGGVVERDEEPEADGHRRDAERQRHQRRRAPRRRRRRERERGAAADDDRDHGRRRPRSAASCGSRRTGATNSVLPGVHLAERAVEVEAEPARACRTTADAAPRSARRGAAPSRARLAATNARAPRRARSARGLAPRRGARA